MKLTDIKAFISKRLGTDVIHTPLWTERNQAEYENTLHEFDLLLTEVKALTGRTK